MGTGLQLPEGGSTPPTDPERRLWFDFLSKLNDRSIQEKRESGATAWVLVAAAVWILYKCVPLIPLFLSLPGALRAASTIFLLEVDGLSFLALALGLALHWADEEVPGRLEPRTFSRPRRLLLLILYIGALVLAAAHGLLAARFAPPGVTRWALVAFCLLWLANFAFPTVEGWRKSSKAKQSGTTVPEFSGLKFPRQVSAFARRCTGYWHLRRGCVPVLPPVSWPLVRRLDYPARCGEPFPRPFAILSILSLRGLSHQSRGAYLKLERAIVVEHISAEEIRARFEEQMLGPEVGNWLKAIGDGFKSECAGFKAALGSVRERTKEVEAIDPKYSIERIGRAKALMADWNKAAESYLSKLDGYVFQLEECNAFPLSADEREILSRILSSWKELSREAKEENHSTAAALTNLVTLLGGERTHAE